jgi:hypothetical protein
MFIHFLITTVNNFKERLFGLYSHLDLFEWSRYYSTPEQQRDPRIKFGVLVILSALAHPLKEHKQFADGKCFILNRQI